MDSSAERPSPASDIDTLATEPGVADTLADEGAAGSTDSFRSASAGLVLAERYRLIELIGRGGMGSVWKGEHLTLGTSVAIKLINSGRVDEPRARERFLREARAAAALRSPHVVQIFDYGVDAGMPFIAMELLEGESLAQRLEREGRLLPAQTLALLGPVLQAMSRAHEAGVVHRDLKPDNIFLVEEDDEGPTAKVVDFGVAKGLDPAILGTTTGSGSMVGTPLYMSPEQMKAGSVGPQTDLWSVAVMVYECLLGRRPVEAETMGELAMALVVEPMPIPSEHGDVPAGFDAWFARATRREPEDRYEDARQMLEALTRVLSPTSEPPVGRSWIPWIAGASLVVGAALALVPGDEAAERSGESAPVVSEPMTSGPEHSSQVATDPPASDAAVEGLGGSSSEADVGAAGSAGVATEGAGAPDAAIDEAAMETDSPTAGSADASSSSSSRGRSSRRSRATGKKRGSSAGESKADYDVEDLEY